MKTYCLKSSMRVLYVGLLALSLLCSVAFANPPQGIQGTASDNMVPENKFSDKPDIRIYELRIYNITNEAGPSPVGSEATAGQQLQIECEYVTCGHIPQTSFFVRLEIDSALLSEGEVSVPPPNHEVNNETCYGGHFRAPWTAKGGSHAIKCILDSKNNVIEDTGYEQNNMTTRTINVKDPILEKYKDIKTKKPIPVPVPGVK